jgi:DNA end-binding protein Ku
MRSMWKGAISFGLVMIPVRLYAATEQKDISFRQVHREDGGRIRFRRVCSADGQEVPYEDVAKGYELPDGEMVVLTEEDMADLPLPSTRSIEVLHFTPAEQLDPILFNRSYYVEPEAAGTRAYVLLRDALADSGRVAVAKVALRQRESLATLRVLNGVLVLETLLWPDEVRQADFPFLQDDVSARPQELTMAESLIDSMTVDFDADEYTDRYREAVIELVAAKSEGRELAQPGPVEVAAESASLADALRASLEAARAGGSERAEDGGGRGPRALTARSDAKSAGSKSANSKAASAKTANAKAAGAKTANSKPASAKPASGKTAAKDGAKTAAKTATSRSGAAKTGGAKPAAKAASGRTARSKTADRQG